MFTRRTSGNHSLEVLADLFRRPLVRAATHKYIVVPRTATEILIPARLAALRALDSMPSVKQPSENGSLSASSSLSGSTSRITESQYPLRSLGGRGGISQIFLTRILG